MKFKFSFNLCNHCMKGACLLLEYRWENRLREIMLLATASRKSQDSSQDLRFPKTRVLLTTLEFSNVFKQWNSFFKRNCICSILPVLISVFQILTSKTWSVSSMLPTRKQESWNFGSLHICIQSCKNCYQWLAKKSQRWWWSIVSRNNALLIFLMVQRTIMCENHRH